MVQSQVEEHVGKIFSLPFLFKMSFDFSYLQQNVLYSPAYSTLMLSLENGPGFTIIINVFCKHVHYLLRAQSWKRAKADREAVGKQGERLLSFCTPHSCGTLLDSCFRTLLLPRPLSCPTFCHPLFCLDSEVRWCNHLLPAFIKPVQLPSPSSVPLSPC